MKAFVFIPDTNKKAGLGHLHRCLKYSFFLQKNNKIFFLIKKNFDKKILKIKSKNKINYFFYNKIYNSLKIIKKKYNKLVIFLDSYDRKIHNFNFNKIPCKLIAIQDKRGRTKAHYIINHTFGLNNAFHNNLAKNKKINVGVQNFPFIEKIEQKNKNIILINFGSIKDIKFINVTLRFLNKLDLNKKLKIVIISKFFLKKNLNNFGIKNKIILYSHVKNFNKIYNKTYFSIGACGISLYEKSFFKIPTIAKSVAKNQYYNYKNFSSKGCIIEFDKIIKINMKSKKNKLNFYNLMNKVKKNLYRYFIVKNSYNHLNKLFSKF